MNLNLKFKICPEIALKYIFFFNKCGFIWNRE